jgi:hypothetical protein
VISKRYNATEQLAVYRSLNEPFDEMSVTQVDSVENANSKQRSAFRLEF